MIDDTHLAALLDVTFCGEPRPAAVCGLVRDATCVECLEGYALDAATQRDVELRRAADSERRRNKAKARIAALEAERPRLRLVEGCARPTQLNLPLIPNGGDYTIHWGEAPFTIE